MSEEIKKLNFQQLILLSKILKKMGLKNNLTNFIFGNEFDSLLKSMNCNTEDKQNMIFINVATFFIENMHLAENDIYNLMADVNNLKVEDIKKYNIDEIIPLIYRIMYGSFPNTIGKMLMLNLEHFKKKMFFIINMIQKIEKAKKKNG
jgi:hypothetical protein